MRTFEEIKAICRNPNHPKDIELSVAEAAELVRRMTMKVGTDEILSHFVDGGSFYGVCVEVRRESQVVL